jgi:hypothetical protein
MGTRPALTGAGLYDNRPHTIGGRITSLGGRKVG